MQTLLEKQTAQNAQDRNLMRKAYGPKYRLATFDIDEDGNPNKSRTIQSSKAECDINNIIKKHDRGEVILHVNKAAAQYGDFSELNEFQESMNIVAEGQQSFAEIPAEIRKKFGNDPGMFLEFVTNPANQDQMVTMGLATKKPLTAAQIEAARVANLAVEAAQDAEVNPPA